MNTDFKHIYACIRFKRDYINFFRILVFFPSHFSLIYAKITVIKLWGILR